MWAKARDNSVNGSSTAYCQLGEELQVNSEKADLQQGGQSPGKSQNTEDLFPLLTVVCLSERTARLSVSYGKQ